MRFFNDHPVATFFIVLVICLTITDVAKIVTHAGRLACP